MTESNRVKYEQQRARTRLSGATLHEVMRPDRDWLAIAGGAVAIAGNLIIGWTWAKENEEL